MNFIYLLKTARVYIWRSVSVRFATQDGQDVLKTFAYIYGNTHTHPCSQAHMHTHTNAHKRLYLAKMHIHGNKMPSSIKLFSIQRYTVNSSLHKEKNISLLDPSEHLLTDQVIKKYLNKKHVFQQV